MHARGERGTHQSLSAERGQSPAKRATHFFNLRHSAAAFFMSAGPIMPLCDAANALTNLV